MERRHHRNPSCSTFAVIAISAMPPGVVPSINVGTGAADHSDSNAPSPNASANAISEHGHGRDKTRRGAKEVGR